MTIPVENAISKPFKAPNSPDKNSTKSEALVLVTGGNPISPQYFPIKAVAFEAEKNK